MPGAVSRGLDSRQLATENNSRSVRFFMFLLNKGVRSGVAWLLSAAVFTGGFGASARGGRCSTELAGARRTPRCAAAKCCCCDGKAPGQICRCGADDVPRPVPATAAHDGPLVIKWIPWNQQAGHVDIGGVAGSREVPRSLPYSCSERRSVQMLLCTWRI
jgi:hypothetical protein